MTNYRLSYKDKTVSTNKWVVLGGCLGILALITLVLAGLSALFITAWNAVIPGLFTGAPTLDFWQGLGIMVLLFIVGGFFKR